MTSVLALHFLCLQISRNEFAFRFTLSRVIDYVIDFYVMLIGKPGDSDLSCLLGICKKIFR